MLQQSHTPLTNGIMSFLEASEDHDLAPIGIGSMHEQAKKLAEYGRHGDIYFVHAAEGETVVPLEVLNANPKVKDMLFNQMREMGLDPEEFVVGNELNSINPVTGMPEFFFSKVWRSVKKAASSVWKGVKKAAPYVVPLVLTYFGVPGAAAGSMFGAGSAGAAFLGGGIGTLLGGGSMKDALKAGAISAGTMALGRGLAGAASKSGTFMGGVGQAFGVSPTTGGATQWNIGFEGPGPQDLVGADKFSVKPPPELSVMPSAETPVPLTVDYEPALTSGTQQVGGGPGSFFEPQAEWGPTYTQGVPLNPQGVPMTAPVDADFTQGSFGTLKRAPPASKLSERLAALKGSAEPQNWYDRALEYTPFGPDNIVRLDDGRVLTGPDAIKYAELRASQAHINRAQLLGANARDPKTIQAAMQAGKDAGTATEIGPLQKYGPTALAAYAINEARQPSQEDLDREQEEKKRKAEREFRENTGAARFARDRARYMLPDEALDPYHFTPPAPPSLYGQAGGLAEYPRRDLLVEGPGTERSDDIPAMLSDGEFVMNAKAVRGADPSGRGNRYAGANNLYNMMRNFEMRS